MYSQSIFNKNSLKLLDKQLYDRFLNPKWNTWLNNINTVKEWMYTNLTSSEVSNLCIIGGSVLSCYGIRPGTDIDAILISSNIKSPNDQTNELINKYFIDKTTKFRSVDIGLEYTKYWKDSWTEKNNEILKPFNIPTFSEIVLNPNYHFYYNGIKFYLIDFEIARKFLRYRAQDYADFVILYLVHKNIIENSIILDDKMHIKLPQYAKDKKLIYRNGKIYDDVLTIIKEKYLPEDYKDITVNIIRALLG